MQAGVAETVDSHDQSCQVHETLESRLHDVSQSVVAEVQRRDMRDVDEERVFDDGGKVVPGEVEAGHLARESGNDGQSTFIPGAVSHRTIAFAFFLKAKTAPVQLETCFDDPVSFVGDSVHVGRRLESSLASFYGQTSVILWSSWP